MTIITYRIEDSSQTWWIKLETTAKLACNFWNRFVQPASSIIVRLGTFNSSGNTIARAYKPYRSPDGNIYGVVQFNVRFLQQFSDYEIAGTIIHEIGHLLGIGYDQWYTLFDFRSGRFTNQSIRQLSDLQYMSVETDYGPGTQYSHWDEESRFKQELMTGFKDKYEYVLPATIRVMRLLGHFIKEDLLYKTPLTELIQEVDGITFSMMESVEKIDLDYFEETELNEEIYFKNKIKKQ